MIPSSGSKLTPDVPQLPISISTTEQTKQKEEQEASKIEKVSQSTFSTPTTALPSPSLKKIVKENISLTSTAITKRISERPVLLELTGSGDISKKDFHKKKIDFDTFTVLNQASQESWLDKCGYHALKNALALCLIEHTSFDQTLLTDEAFFEEIFNCISEARPSSLKNEDINIIALNESLKVGSPLDKYLKTKSNHFLGVKELNHQISLFNYSSLSETESTGVLDFGDATGLPSINHLVELGKKLGKPLQPFIHHFLMGNAGHWNTISLFQDDEGKIRLFGTDSWNNQKDLYKEHIGILNYALQHTHEVQKASYHHLFGASLDHVSAKIKTNMKPLDELSLLLDNDAQSLGSDDIQNLICKILDIESSESLGARCVFQRFGLPIEEDFIFSDEELLQGNLILNRWGISSDPDIPLEPDPIKAVNRELRSKERGEFQKKYENQPDKLKKDHPQHYFMKLFGLNYREKEIIPQNTIADKILSLGLKHRLLSNDHSTEFPSVFDALDFMKEAGWLNNSSSKLLHKREISTLRNIFQFYITHRASTKEIKDAFTDLS